MGYIPTMPSIRIIPVVIACLVPLVVWGQNPAPDQAPTPAPSSTPPPIVAPKDLETALEIPYRVVLSPADPVGYRNRRLAAMIKDLAEHQIVDWCPAPISLCDPLAVDIRRHSPALKSYPRIASTSGGAVRPAVPFSERLLALALWIKPPPSTRARPEGAS